MSNRALSFVVFALALAFLIAPALNPPFTGYTPDQLPVPQPDPLMQPPNWMFLIWLPIYSWLLGSAGFGVLKRATAPDWAPMRPPLALALALGTLWLSIAGVVPIVAAFTIAVMTYSAIRVVLLSGTEDVWLQLLPNGLFAGWLTAATGLSFSIILAGFGVMGEGLAVVVSLSLVLVVALAVLWHRPAAWTYAVGSGWALVGVVVSAAPRDAWLVVGLAVLGIVALGAVLWVRKP